MYIYIYIYIFFFFLAKHHLSLELYGTEGQILGCLPPENIMTCLLFVFHLLSPLQLFVTPWTEACQASMSFTISQRLLKFMLIESVMPLNHLIFWHPHSPAFNLSQHQGLSNELALHIKWPKYWSFSFSIGPSNEYSGLISFRTECFISLLSKRFSRVFSSITIQKYTFLMLKLLYVILEKP